MIYLKDTENQSKFDLLAQYNFGVIETWFLYHKPTKDGSEETTVKGPPTAGEWTAGRLWRDALLSLFRCTVAGTPGTWVQVEAAIVAAFPEGVPDGYRVLRSDENYKAYRYNLATAAWVETGGGVGGISDDLQRVKAPVDYVAHENINGTYDVPTGTLTGNDIGVLYIGGVPVQTGKSVLVRWNDEANGIYVITQAGDQATPFVLTRRDDADTAEKLLGSVVSAIDESTYVSRVPPGFTLGAAPIYFDELPASDFNGVMRIRNTLQVPIGGGISFGSTELGFVGLFPDDDGSMHLGCDSRVKANSFSTRIDESIFADGAGDLIIDSQAGIIHVAWSDSGGPFTLHGILRGFQGKRVTVRNKTGFAMSVAHNSASGPLGLRIVTPTGATLTPVSLITLYYDPTELAGFGGWVVENYY